MLIVHCKFQPHIDGLMQTTRNSIATALRLRNLCIKPSMWQWARGILLQIRCIHTKSIRVSTHLQYPGSMMNYKNVMPKRHLYDFGNYNFVIQPQHYTGASLIYTDQPSLWWLQMVWCLIGTISSTTTMFTWMWPQWVIKLFQTCILCYCHQHDRQRPGWSRFVIGTGNE